jgi:hypothetical protein
MVAMRTTSPSETAVATVSPTPAAVETALPVSNCRPSSEKLPPSRLTLAPSPKKLWTRLKRATASCRSSGNVATSWRDCASTTGTTARPKIQSVAASAAITASMPHARGRPRRWR